MEVLGNYRLSMYQDYGPLDSKEHIRLVRNKRTGQICVKKVIDYAQPDIVKFRQESNSSYFPKLVEILKENDKYIMMEEYVNGVTLEEYMMGRPLLEEEAVRIARQICKGLAQLHRFVPMIVYRDLKAENIMIDIDGNVKLIDFNISRSFQEGKKRDTELLGTAEYAAPEQFGYFQTDNRTDIYAFGVLFNYMLTGKFPVETITEGQFGGLIRKCTELEPSKRYQRMEEILKELGEAETVGICEKRYAEKQYTERKSTDSLKKESWMIPGFRSKTGWKMLIAILGYIVIFYIGLTSQFVKQDGGMYTASALWMNRVIVTLAQLISVFFCCNYRGMSEQFPIYRNRFAIVRVISYVVTWFVFLFAGVLVSGILESVFGL